MKSVRLELKNGKHTYPLGALFAALWNTRFGFEPVDGVDCLIHPDVAREMTDQRFWVTAVASMIVDGMNLPDTMRVAVGMHDLHIRPLRPETGHTRRGLWEI